MKSAIVIALSLLFCAAGAEQAKETSKVDVEPSFRIFLVDGKVDDVDKDIQDEIGEFKLEDEPVLTEKDIKAYHWDSHTIEVTAKAIERFKKMIVLGKPEGRDVTTRELFNKAMGGRAFVVVVNGRRAYVGILTSPISSHISRAPVIDVSFGKDGPENMPENSIRIEVRREDERQNDLRSQDWIKSALKALDKLK